MKHLTIAACCVALFAGIGATLAPTADAATCRLVAGKVVCRSSWPIPIPTITPKAS